MKPFLTAARIARPAAKSLASIPAARPVRPAVLKQLPRRGFTTTPPKSARYERFDFPSSGQPGGSNNVTNFLRRRLGGDRGMIVFGVATGFGVIYYVAHLERVPETGRLRFMDCSPEQEQEIGKASFVETIEQFGMKCLPPNHPITRRVREIATRIVEGNALGHMKSAPGLGAVEARMSQWGMDESGNVYSGDSADDQNSTKNEWEVFVVDDPKTKNAFVIPGGKIFVFTGILPVSANDDGLATVMGHEIAHVVARHGAERMSSMKVLFGISFLLESLGLDVGLTRLLVTFLLQLPNSRTNESEADTIGLNLMAKACYHPSEAPKMWERMSAADGGGGNLDFMSTHPANAKRIKALMKEQPEATKLREDRCQNVPTTNKDFSDAMRNLSSSSSSSNDRRSVWA